MAVAETDQKATFESVWALIQENAREIANLRESQRETDRQMKEYNKRFGEFTNRFGEVVEYMIAPNFLEKFRELEFNFTKAVKNIIVEDKDHNIKFEVDVMLENSQKVMLVEIKTNLTTDDVKEHIIDMEKMRKYADIHGDKRSFLGSVAGVVMTDNVKQYALKKGLFVIEPSGETFIINSPNDALKEW